MAAPFSVAWQSIIVCPLFNDLDISAGSVALMAGGLVSSHCASVKFEQTVTIEF
jgi:hypothetical protein